MSSSIETKEKDVRRLGDILRDVTLMNVPQNIIDEAVAMQNTLRNLRHPVNKRLGEILIDSGMVSRDKVYRALARQNGMEYVPAQTIKGQANYKIYRHPDIVQLFGNRGVNEFLNSVVATQCVPTHFVKDPNTGEKTLVLVMTNPENKMKIEKNLLFHLRDIKHQVVMSDNSIFEDFKLKYNALTLEELKEFSRNIDIEQSFNVNPEKRITIDQFLQYLLSYAILERASDIHLLPNSNDMVRVAVRVMGVMETLFYISYSTYNRLIRNIKTKSGMKESVVGTPQDGRIDGSVTLKSVDINLNRPDAIVDARYGLDENHLHYEFTKASFRVSAYPTEPIAVNFDVGNSFESLVLRVLNLSQGYTELGDLGLSLQATTLLDQYKNRTQGIIIIVGPTGSGKSTTLYSLLSSINCLEKKVITFEDPVEMRQLFWAQGQRKIVEGNEASSFDFDDAIKSILRQDPNIIMMAEVRDKATAEFAITAANTGHLVVTTLHSNSAASAIERLKKLGVQGLDIGTSVLCIMGQRIVRKLCPHCHEKRAPNEREIAELKSLELSDDKIPLEVSVKKEGGCEYCNGKGYIGAVVINEIIPFNKELRQIIIDDGSELEIRNKADEGEYYTMLEDGISKSAAGICDINDVVRAL